MKTQDIVSCMVRRGLKDAGVTTEPSTRQPYDVAGEKETVVESFVAKACDGSQFLVTVTKIVHEHVEAP